MHKKNNFKKIGRYAGCPIKIFKITLLPNYKTYRKSENSFGLVGKRATNTSSYNMT